ncbi:TPA: hypothetical protein ACIPUI_001157 [Citrobacter freundii]
MARDNGIKRQADDKSTCSSRQPLTFMEFVHRQEERLESHMQEMKKSHSQAESAEPLMAQKPSTTLDDSIDTPPVMSADVIDLLLMGVLAFIFITMLFLFIN